MKNTRKIFMGLIALLVMTSCSGDGDNNDGSGNNGNNNTVDNSNGEGYYSAINNAWRGDQLKTALYNLLDSTYHPTVSGYGNLWTIFPYSDADPSNPTSGKIVSFYSGNLSTKGSMNKEHVWPKSRGGASIEADAHMIRPTIVAENSSRGNDFFNEGANWDPASFNNPKYRGIAARICFYAATKKKNNLTLVDKNTDATVNTSTGTMGKLSTLLKWNIEYGIDATETLRNNVLVNKYKYCHNPFIDNPSYACRIWGGTNSTTQQICDGHY